MRQALELALEALQVATTPLAKDRQEVLRAITAIKEALAQPEQEPVAWIEHHKAGDNLVWDEPSKGTPLYTTPPQRTWIDPNDKTQERFLPNIGEPILFCHEGKTYYGKHNGGSFQHRGVFQQQYFRTWECHWMPLPAAHGIKE